MPPMPITTARTDYSAVKAAIHRKLIQKLNLDKLSEIKREDVRRERAVPLVKDRGCGSQGASPMNVVDPDDGSVYSAVGRRRQSFVDDVIPVLQHRGRVRTRYSGTTLRDVLLQED